MRILELLAPAKNAEYGIEAIKHGADAVYIGAPMYGARAAVGNSVEEIETLVRFAHTYGARVYVALNTILTDEELPQAVKMAQQLYDLGADALIIQDYGLLHSPAMPPIPLHASTQMDNHTVERIAFVATQGFEQIVVPREFSPAQIARVHRAVPEVRLECFVHGALCVSYSGRCYAAAAFHGRSANRGACSQVCRLAFDLYDGTGRKLQSHKHLLSVKDLNRSEVLAQLISAGVTSFKIEGRLKDIAYLKNVTAHYHQLLDAFIRTHEGYQRASHGAVTHLFTPDIDRVFNRGYTSFVHNGRKDDHLAAFDTPKSMGKRVGEVVRLERDLLTIKLDPNTTIANGDGLSYHLAQGGTAGLKVNIAQGNRLVLNNAPQQLPKGTPLYRNSDLAFDRAMLKETAQRELPIVATLQQRNDETRQRLLLHVQELQSGIGVEVTSDAITLEVAQNPDSTYASVLGVLEKCGGTPFRLQALSLDDALRSIFIPRSILTTMRRTVLEELQERLIEHFKGTRNVRGAQDRTAQYPESSVDYRANVYNATAAAFYREHGVEVTAPAYEEQYAQGQPIMYTKHCIRYSLGQCPTLQGYKQPHREPWVLKSCHNGEDMRIKFDCEHCMMLLYPLS